MSDSPNSAFQQPSATDADGTAPAVDSTDLDAIASEFDRIEAALPQLDNGTYFSGIDAHLSR